MVGRVAPRAPLALREQQWLCGLFQARRARNDAPYRLRYSFFRASEMSAISSGRIPAFSAFSK
jgi:hypothetical protein